MYKDIRMRDIMLYLPFHRLHTERFLKEIEYIPKVIYKRDILIRNLFDYIEGFLIFNRYSLKEGRKEDKCMFLQSSIMHFFHFKIIILNIFK